MLILNEKINPFFKRTVKIKYNNKIYTISNTILDNQWHIYCLCLSSEKFINKIGFGAFDNVYDVPESTNTAMTDLQCPFKYYKDIDGVEYINDFIFKIKFSLNETEMNGYNIKEFGLFVDNIMFSRIISIQNFLKEEHLGIEGEWQIEIIKP